MITFNRYVIMFYDEEFEKRKLLMHKLKVLPNDMLKQYIFKPETQISIEDIPHLRLNSI